MKKSCTLIHIVLAILAVQLVPAQAAGSLDNWIWRNPLPTGSYLSGVASGLVNGTSEFVAVGYDSTILTSQSGAAWYQQPSPANLTLTVSSLAARPSRRGSRITCPRAETHNPRNTGH